MRRELYALATWLVLGSVAAAQPSVSETADAAVDPAPIPSDGTSADSPTAAAATEGDAPSVAMVPYEPPELTPAELQAFGLSSGSASAGIDKTLRFSGFSDFTVAVPVKPRGAASIFLPRNSTMYIGNLNLYFTRNLSESFRIMGEVRFTYLPNGSQSETDPTASYNSTFVRDYADVRRVAPWGSVMIQRMYLEWGGLDGKLFLRAGQFLTPYGIWNIDHGSPTFIPVQRPFAVGNDWFPERQTGLEAFGRWNPAIDHTIGYHLTFSNGGGPISDYKDLDKNKAWGGRVFWELRKLGLFHIGASGYYGTYTASTPKFSLSGTNVNVSDKLTQQYDSLALAADVLFKYEGFHLQGEWVSQQRRYTTEGRAVQTLPPFGSVTSAFPIDSFDWALYALVGYRFPWMSLMPYVIVQHDREVIESQRTNLIMAAGGINMHLIDEVIVKAEYYRSVSLHPSQTLIKDPLQSVQFQAAFAF